MSVIHWPEIALFHNIRKFVNKPAMEGDPDPLHGNKTVNYQAKIKLHGANCAVQVYSDGKVIPQSRTVELSVDNDNAGFARWVKKNEENWQRVPHCLGQFDGDVVVYGEWIGKGVNKSDVAVSLLPNKVFAVFAARHLDKEGNPKDYLIVDPIVLEALVEGIPETYVLPWFGDSISIDWKASDEDLKPVMDKINDWVSQIEKSDPWVRSTFGVEGTGEGLVFYPLTNNLSDASEFTDLSFKAKGEKHQVIKTKAPTQLSAESAASITEFVDMVLTEARLDQGVLSTDAKDFDMKKVGKFLAWVFADVQKEAQDELDASGLDWKQVQKPLSDKARTWYFNKAKSK